MKKFFTTTLITIIAISILSGCADNQATISKNDTKPITVVKAVEPFNMEKSEIREMYLKLYEEKSASENFITDVEAKTYEECNLYIRNREKGYVTSYNVSFNETRNYYYPIVLPDTDEVVIAYTNEYGGLCLYNALKDSHDYCGSIHIPEDTDFIDVCANYSVVYTNNSVQIWEFGKLVAETTVPEGAIYTGFSYWEGYIFRNGGDVYSVQLKEENEKPLLLCEPIAHNVKEVILTDYKLNSDAWAQPLFLMEDGSIKAYCVWNGDSEAPRNDACHLTSPQHEGGHK